MSNTITTCPNEVQWADFIDNGFLIQGPDSSTIWGGVGQSDSGGLSFFHTNFFSTQMNEFYPNQVFSLSLDELIKALDSLHLESPSLVQMGNNDEGFLKDLAHSIETLRASNTLSKVVPVACATYKFKGHPLANLRKFAQLGGGLYGKWSQGKGVLGCSPEVLFSRTESEEKFQALAGTMSLDKKTELIESEKDRIEHELVVEDIFQKLGNDPNLQIGKRHIRQFGHLCHLQTWLSRPRSNSDERELIHQLHPTAALSGYPRSESLEFLKTLSHYRLTQDERSFGGLFGAVFENLSFAYVAIRNIQWDNGIAYINSGCGVVAQSEPLKELSEIQKKRATIERIFL